jgi:O-antigen ligase
MTVARTTERDPHWAATLGTVLFAVLFLTNWPTYHYSIGGPVALLYYVLPAATLPILLASRPNALRLTVQEPLVFWFLIYVATGLIWLMASGGFLEEESRQWRLRLLALISLVIAFLLTAEANRGIAVKVILLCAVLASICNWLDFLFPFTFVEQGAEDSNPGRGAGLFINANFAGTAVIAMAIAVLPFVPMKWRAAVLLLMMAGVLPTLSRSTITFAGIVVILAFALRQVSRRQVAMMGIGVLALAPVVWSLHQYAIDFGKVNVEDARQRIEFFTSIGEALDDSAAERREVSNIAWQMFADKPLLGHGLGSSPAAYAGRGTHNMYLMLLAEQGVLGGALYVSLVLILLLKGSRLSFRALSQEDRDIGAGLLLMTAFVAIVGLFTHNLLERPSNLFLLAFLVSAAWRGGRTPVGAQRARPSLRAHAPH